MKNYRKNVFLRNDVLPVDTKSLAEQKEQSRHEETLHRIADATLESIHYFTAVIEENDFNLSDEKNVQQASGMVFTILRRARFMRDYMRMSKLIQNDKLSITSPLKVKLEQFEYDLTIFLEKNKQLRGQDNWESFVLSTENGFYETIEEEEEYKDSRESSKIKARKECREAGMDVDVNADTDKIDEARSNIEKYSQPIRDVSKLTFSSFTNEVQHQIYKGLIFEDPQDEEIQKKLKKKLSSLGTYHEITAYEDNLCNYSDQFYLLHLMIRTHSFIHNILDLPEDLFEFVAQNTAAFWDLTPCQRERIMRDPWLLNVFRTEKLSLKQFASILYLNADESDKKFNAMVKIFQTLESYFNAEHIKKLGFHRTDGNPEQNEAIQVLNSPASADIEKKMAMRRLFDPIIMEISSDAELIAQSNCLAAILDEVYALADIWYIRKKFHIFLQPECMQSIKDNILDKDHLIRVAREDYSGETLESITSRESIRYLRSLQEKQGAQYNAKKMTGYAWNKINNTEMHMLLNQFQIAMRQLPPNSYYYDEFIEAGNELVDTFKKEETIFTRAVDPIEAEKIYIISCLKSIEKTRPVLEKCHPVRKILLNIANALLKMLSFLLAPFGLKVGLFKDKGKAMLNSLTKLHEAIIQIEQSSLSNTLVNAF